MDKIDLTESLHSRIMCLLLENNIPTSVDISTRLTLILSNYKIEPKETALAICHEGKNERLVKRFLLAKAVAGRGQKTIRQYQSEILRALEKMGKDADQVTAEDVQIYIARLLTKGNTKSYCDTVRRYLSSFFGYLYREELIVRNPMDKVDAIKYKREKEAAFSDMEVEQIRAACRTSFEKALVEMLLSTGCRASELCSIKIEDIDDGKVQIIGKGEKVRTVYMNAKAIVSVNTYLAERSDSNPYLFPGGIFGGKKNHRETWYRHPETVSQDQSYGHESINGRVRVIGERAGIENVHTHRFRRTCATHALRHGMPIEMVSMMLGHEQISTTQIYLDLREEDLAMAHGKYVV